MSLVTSGQTVVVMRYQRCTEGVKIVVGTWASMRPTVRLIAESDCWQRASRSLSLRLIGGSDNRSGAM